MPSRLLTFVFCIMYHKRMLAISEKIIRSENAVTFTLNGASRKVNPKIRVMFKKQLPMTFPTARSKKPLLTESKLVASSGMLVPKATMVEPTMTGGTPALSARKDADSTMK